MRMSDWKRPVRVLVLSLLPILAPGHLDAEGDRQTPPAEPAASPNGSAGSERLVARNGLRGFRLVPSPVRLLGEGASQTFLVVATDARGLEIDLTPEARFSLSDDRLAQVEPEGLLTARRDGEVTLRAEIAGQRLEAAVRIEGTGRARPFGFARDVVGIFTRNGCNGSECHGGVKGRGGFKLSLHGINPREDYRWTVKGGVYQVLSPKAAEPFDPRVNLEEPHQSRLLLKPVLELPHGGGQRFERDSADYRRLLEWIRQGAPYGAGPAESRIERLEVFPREAIMEPGARRRLLVTAFFEDGRAEDLSPEVLYESSDPAVIDVTPSGVVRALKPGQARVTVRAAGKLVQVRCGVIRQPLDHYPEVARRNFIDDVVFDRLRDLHIVPAGLSSDSAFLRRVCLDLTGTLPPPERVREFLADRNPLKREHLIERLLNSPEFVDYWTFRFADFFRVVYRNAYVYKSWIRESLARNKPYDQMARERVASQGNGGPTRHFIKSISGEVMRPHEKMGEDVRVFLGIRLDCAQCHDHPYETWTQDQFWGITAFYGQLTRIRDLSVFMDDTSGNEEQPEGPKVIHPRRRREVAPSFLDGSLPPSTGINPREQLADWMTSPQNPYFSQAIVNRVWANFFGKGLVEPVDDFRPGNPASHPELLGALAEDFRLSGYDLKHLMRAIARSGTYQLSGDLNSTNREDEVNHSRALPRRLEAEILLDAISRVTGIEEAFAVHEYVGGGTEPKGTRAIELVPEVTPSQFLEVYGRPVSRDSMPWRDYRSTLRQALHLLVGSTYTTKIAAKGGRVSRLLSAGVSDREIVRELYLAALSRFPTAEEETRLQALIEGAPSRGKGVENLAWGLLASRQFTYNH
ncbi:MAG: DUF1553 domain-containing protein [Acidobacteriota bacterium]|nr:DUF1553 domain-containing protein [Acidobacteriota bacterium]